MFRKTVENKKDRQIPAAVTLVPYSSLYSSRCPLVNSEMSRLVQARSPSKRAVHITA
jgi:hypothetical protein